MKTHTYFLSGKALAIVVTALSTSGAMVFLLGVFVGIVIQPVAPRPGAPALRDAAIGPGPIASATPTAVGSEATAAWPFSVAAGAEPAPAAEEPARPAPSDTARKAKPDSLPRRRATEITGVAFVAPVEEPARVAPAPDTARYFVQVGQFRIERNARALVARLEVAGYRPTVTVQEDSDRALHVVRVGRYIGRVAAESAALEIGDAERLVASVVSARRYH